MGSRVTKEEMLEAQLRGRDIENPRVLEAMEEVDRALFVPPGLRDRAYEDRPLPLEKGQTISQPYIVAYMAQALSLSSDDVVLEVGAGCGYNAAVLSRLAKFVYSVEIVEWLAQSASNNLDKAGIENVEVRQGDGYQGWPERAPFDAIVLTAAPSRVPDPLKEQLKVGGRLLAPVGGLMQQLVMLRKEAEGRFREEVLLPVAFVPMTGKAQE